MIAVLQKKSTDEVYADLVGFPERYVRDWETWLRTIIQERPKLFVKTLGKWQATRPLRLRRLKGNAQHEPPYIEDLLESAVPHLATLNNLDMASFQKSTDDQHRSLQALWVLLSQLPQRGLATDVGISKAVLLLTDGRIGPAFDSRVRKNLGLPRLVTADQWINTLIGVSADIRAFEQVQAVRLSAAVPHQFSHLQYGRLYDMALGPR